MGNQLAPALAPTHDYYLHDFSAAVSFQQSLGAGRLFRTTKCLHDEGTVVVKVYFKRENTSLKQYEKDYEDIRDKLSLRPEDQPNLFTFSKAAETDKAAYLMRQYFHTNLRDRMSTRPFLSSLEKRWIAYQLICAVKQAHGVGVCHGDIKSENIMVTTWDWIYLTDFAPFKPTYLPADNPADFSYYFDTGSTRRCYVAPERFYGPKQPLKGPLAESMDIFSLGCVIAEIFLDGTPCFDLSSILSYRDGSFNLKEVLLRIDQPDIAKVIEHMLQLDPSKRFSAAKYLEEYSGSVFPQYFEFLHAYIAQSVWLDPDSKIQRAKEDFDLLVEEIAPKSYLQNQRHRSESLMAKKRLSARFASITGSIAASEDGESFPTSRPSDADVPADRISLPVNHSSQLLADVHRFVDEIDSDIKARGAKGPSADSPTPPAETTKKKKGFLGLTGGKGNSGKKVKDDEAHTYPHPHPLTRSSSSGGGTDYRPAPIMEASTVGFLCATEDCVRQGLQNALDDPVTGLISHVPTPPYTLSSFVSVDDVHPHRHTHLSTGGGGAVVGSARGSTSNTVPRAKGLTMIVSLICSTIRNARSPSSKLTALQLLLRFGAYLDDDIRMQRLVPYIVAMLSDASAVVRATAVGSLTKVLAMVETLLPADLNVFQEYILPSLSFFPSDGEELVRVAYAENVAQLAETAGKFLDIAYLVKIAKEREKVEGGGSGQVHEDTSYDVDLLFLQDSFANVVVQMLTENSSNVKRALLKDITRLCRFFGRQKTNDFLLPLLIALLNDRDWDLRASFFEHFVGVAAFVGRTSLEYFILPCIDSILIDVEEFVIEKALNWLSSLTDLGLFDRRVLVDLSKKVTPLLCHPNIWVRYGTVSVITSIAKQLDPVDVHCFLRPVLKNFLRLDVLDIGERSLILALKTPVSRFNFDRAKAIPLEGAEAQPGESVDSLLWESNPLLTNGPVRDLRRVVGMNNVSASVSSTGSMEQSFVNLDHLSPGARTPVRLSTATPMQADSKWPLRHYIDMLSDEDEEKLLAMKGYIVRLSQAIQAKVKIWETENEARMQSGGDMHQYAELENYVEPVTANLKDHTDMFYPPPTKIDNDATAEPEAEDWHVFFGVPQHGKRTQGGKLSRNPMTGQHLSQQQQNTPRDKGDGSGAEGTSGGDDKKEDDKERNITKKTDLPAGALAAAAAAKRAHNPALTPSSARGGGQRGGAVTARVPTDTDSEEIRRLRQSLSVPDPPPDMGAALVHVSGESLHNWRPRGLLVAHLHEHKAAVNQICVFQDNLFMASCSDDGSVKIWDCQKFEKDAIHQSRLEYKSQGGKIKAVTMCENTHSVASASDNGSIHVFKIDYDKKPDGSVQRMGGCSTVKNLQCEPEDGAVLAITHFNTDHHSLLVYATQGGAVRAWDLRSKKEVWHLQANRKVGLIQTLAVDPRRNWVVAGTSRGFMLCWDIRFQIVVKTWRHPSKCRIHSLTPYQCSNERAWVFVAAGRSEVGVWDIESGACMQQFRVLTGEQEGPETPTQVLGEPSAEDFAQEDLENPARDEPSMRSMFYSPEGSFLLTGGSDKKIRFWDLGHIERSYVVCGPRSVDSNTLYNTYKRGQVTVYEELPANKRDAARSTDNWQKELKGPMPASSSSHDAILDMQVLQIPHRMLVSCSRNGVIQVWK